MKYKWREKWKRVIAGGLTVLILCPGTGGSLSAYGAQADVDVDETMYVNLDFYGAVTKVNVVKSCVFNGRTEYIDYGHYLDVKNMTNDAAPVLEGGMVKWTMPNAQTGRFYYQCALDTDQVTLPWDFDVSYKLNGVPTDADKLAGVSGLVEINIKARPNDKAKPYYRDNMILMAAVPVDMSKCYSVEADDSQTQNMGETTAVVFSALPGEEGDFTVRIGSDSFETIGVILSMVPGTINDLKHIKDIKEAKDTWKDAGDQLYDSLEQITLSVEGMREGVNQVQAGVDSTESARQKWSASKDSILEGNDQVLAALTAMSSQMEAMMPYLQTAKDSAQVVHKSMNDIVNTLGEMQEPLRKLYDRLRNIKSSSESISENLPEIQTAMERLLLLDFQLQQNEDLFMLNLKSTRESSLRANSLYYDTVDEDELEEEIYWSDDYLGIKDKAQDTGDVPRKEAIGDSDKDADRIPDSSESKSAPDTSGGESSFPDSPQTIGTVSSSIEKRSIHLLRAGSAADIISGLTSKGKALTTIASQSKELTNAMSNLMGDTSDVAKYSSELVDNLDFLIEDITALSDSLDIYYPDLQNCLDDTKELVNCTTDALNSGISTLTIVQNTLKDTSNDFDAAARDSLRGSMELLDKSLNILDSATSLRHAARAMRDTMDNELDKFDTDNRFLFMDPSAQKVSFTSEKNRAPKTLQIVLRTDEISLEDNREKITDGEMDKAKANPLNRMWNVLVEMWRAIVSVFRNR